MPTNCLSVFDRLVELALKGLTVKFLSTARKLNVHKILRRRHGRPMYDQFKSYFQGEASITALVDIIEILLLLTLSNFSTLIFSYRGVFRILLNI